MLLSVLSWFNFIFCPVIFEAGLTVTQNREFNLNLDD